MAVITVPRILREKLGEEGADSLIELINSADTGVKEDVLVFVEEKFERRLAEELSKVSDRITKEIAGVNERLTKEIAGINDRITKEIAGVSERITKEIAGVNERITKEIGSVNEKIAETNTNISVKIAEAKSELIRWMFIFWVGQVGVTIGILFAFFRR